MNSLAIINSYLCAEGLYTVGLTGGKLFLEAYANELTHHPPSVSLDTSYFFILVSFNAELLSFRATQTDQVTIMCLSRALRYLQFNLAHTHTRTHTHTLKNTGVNFMVWWEQFIRWPEIRWSGGFNTRPHIKDDVYSQTTAKTHRPRSCSKENIWSCARLSHEGWRRLLQLWNWGISSFESTPDSDALS